MKTYGELRLLVGVVGTMAGFMSPATAAVLTLGGMADPTAGMVSAQSGITSRNTFDESAPCDSVTSLAPTYPDGSFRTGTGDVVNVRRAPEGDTSCYASVDYGVEQISFFSKHDLSYFGFYWGSVDPYNEFAIRSGTGAPLTITAGTFTGTSITGAELRQQFGLTDTNGRAPSVFVNLSLSSSETAASFLFGSVNNAAFEFDNIAAISRSLPPLMSVATFAARNAAVRNVVVPEPLGFGLLGGAVLALAGARRRARG